MRPATRTSFKNKVLKVVSLIPRGTTLSYKEVALKAGSPNALRAVGSILNKNYSPDIPCHRVIKANGKIGGYNKGPKKKKELLAKEKGEECLSIN